MRAAGEVHFIARFKSDTHQSDMPFQAAGRIERSVHVVRSQVVDGTRKRPAGSGPRIQPEINKSAFYGQERANRTMTGSGFRAEEPMQNSDIAVCHRDPAASTNAPL